MNLNKILFTIFVGLLFSSFSFADRDASKDEHSNHKMHKKHEHSDQEASLQKVASDKLIIKVKGMVCAFCAQGIEKNFNKQEEVKKTTVDLDTMEVTVLLKKGKSLSEETIKSIVTDAGFSFAGIKK